MYPGCIIENEACNPDGSTSQERRWCRKQSPLQAWILSKVLGSSPSPDVVLVGLANPLQEIGVVGIAQVTLKCPECISFCLGHLIFGVRCSDAVEEVHDRGWCNLLNLGSNKESGDSHQLELSLGDGISREDAVNDIDSKEKCFSHSKEMGMNMA